jgi:hypothetical protein
VAQVHTKGPVVAVGLHECPIDFALGTDCGNQRDSGLNRNDWLGDRVGMTLPLPPKKVAFSHGRFVNVDNSPSATHLLELTLGKFVP